MDFLQLLKPWLMGDEGSVSREEIAATFNLTQGAIRMAIHRMRNDFGKAIRAEIAQPMNSPEDMVDELRHLIEALSAANDGNW